MQKRTHKQKMFESYLNLAAVEVHGHNAIHTHGLQQSGDIGRRDGHAGLHLAVLTGIAVVRNHRSDLARRSTAHRGDHQQKLHEGLVHRRQSRLHQVHVLAADVFVDLDVHLAISEAADSDVAQAKIEVLGNLLSQSGVGSASEDLNSLRQVCKKEKNETIRFVGMLLGIPRESCMMLTFSILDWLGLAIRNRDTGSKQSTRKKEHIFSSLFNIQHDDISGTELLYS